ncbi:MAG: ATP-binding protein [Magnetococcales bacterium]|nr:ATP-binding protein [Magnetococcales bacterium]
MAKFRVRARTVDMLGRQQIAGIPTAISELFKNAHDAYARRAEVDYFRDEQLFILRDDGLGMTLEDFEQRWLTLGTDSKVSGGGIALPPNDPDQNIRPILGEKGIGRLAIAILGPQVLVVTRARREGRPSPTTVVAYLHWGLFALPGLDLDDIVIPIREIPGGTMPDAEVVHAMVKEASDCLTGLAGRANQESLASLIEEMANFVVDPAVLSAEMGEPSLIGDGCGTHFYISPADSLIKDDIDGREGEEKATRFEKNLIGFTNTMTPGHARPRIITTFRDYIDEGAPVERIGEKVFFTPDEYKMVDHHVIGRFDEYGQFRGEIGVYQTKPDPYVLSWDKADGLPTACGPFTLSFAYLQGNAKDSLVPLEEYTRLRYKLERHGGLYIYRDGVRVQPYGDSDYDWLDIEKRRTLHAARYFYSYRRMFGVIELSTADNASLTEKAGREGFRENKAYRQLRSILMNFFLQTAADFFREEGRYADQWAERREELNRSEEIRKKKSAQVTVKKAKLRKELDTFFTGIGDKEPELAVERIVREAKIQAGSILEGGQPASYKAAALIGVERDARLAIRREQGRFTVSKPRGVGLPRTLSNEWGAYQAENDRLQGEVFGPAENDIERLVSEYAKNGGLPLANVARLDSAVRERAKDLQSTTRSIKLETETLLSEVAGRVRDTSKASFKAVEQVVDDVLAELERLKCSSVEVGAFSEMRENMEKRLNTVFEQERLKLQRIRDQLATVGALWDENGFDTAELTEALEEELDDLRSSREADLELAQIGMALNTVTHEFGKTVGALRSGFRRMSAWASEYPVLRDLYCDMRSAFDHLDGYLTLFTPLDRRLNRKKTRIKGRDIYDFIENLFHARLERHTIALEADQAFLDTVIVGYTSSFYPVFVNLVDNSVYWLQGVREGPRRIEFVVDGSDLLVRDNGPGVSPRDRDNIFLLNFSRRPGGRGMGLYLSRETLKKAEYVISLDVSHEYVGAVFRLSPDPEKKDSTPEGEEIEDDV